MSNIGKLTEGNLALESRESLPEPLRVLLAEYPREAWQQDPGFSELIRFWLDRHLMFRRLLDHLTADAEGLADKRMEGMAYARSLSRFGGMFVGELHGHHSIEDHHYFPKLRGLEPDIEVGFDLLDGDHHALDCHLGDFTNAANALLSEVSSGSKSFGALAPFQEKLRGMEGVLDRHLTDEEDLIVPVLLKHGSRGLE